MKLHLDQIIFKQFINKINSETNIAMDILEKDYYVCLILKELSKKQDEIKAYFKGGTAIYKILDTMNRFSEDIDLTVKVVEEQSSTQNKNRLKKSALGYKIDGLELAKEECIDKKGSVTAIYKYNSVFEIEEIPLQRAGKIQIESTSFTVSEPIEKRVIEPIIYKFANENEKNILKEKYDVFPIEIDIIKLERMFIDKIFAAEFYYIREMYTDTAKHIYDICILFDNEKIQNLLKDTKELEKLINYKRQEEKVRLGGVDENTLLKDFSYLNCEFSKEFIDKFNSMQNKYIISEKYKLQMDDIKEKLIKIKKLLEK
jgi:hypothetical protein